MTWTVMRREVDRNVRVAECETKGEARAHLRDAQRAHPDEDAWIEGPLPESNGLPPAPPIVEQLGRSVPRWRGEVPAARVVSEQGGSRIMRVRSAPSTKRVVPWRAGFALVDRAFIWIMFVFLFVVLPYVFIRIQIVASGNPLVQPVSVTELAFIAGVAAVAFLVILAVWLRSARAFLQRALVIEGVVTPRGIEVTLDGRTSLVARARRMSAEGSSVHLFWFGRKVVQLDRIGATYEPNGDVVWQESTELFFLIGYGLVAVLAFLIAVAGGVGS